MLFVAYSGEGLEGGEYIGDPRVSAFLSARPALARLEPETIVRLRAVGGGAGNKLEISAAGSLRLAELLERAARRVGARSVRASESIGISVVYDERSAEGPRVREAPAVRLSWQGWEENTQLPADTLEGVSTAPMDKAGRVLALALMVLGRERTY